VVTDGILRFDLILNEDEMLLKRHLAEDKNLMAPLTLLLALIEFIFGLGKDNVANGA
jgi:hypothetical protein